MTLSIRQERFAKEYVVDLRAEQAALRAGYHPRLAQAYGQRLLNQPEVLAAIEEEFLALQK
ncbi:MAG: terminase small subunit, partial [Ardenticatenaceae bacterium]